MKFMQFNQIAPLLLFFNSSYFEHDQVPEIIELSLLWLFACVTNHENK